MKAFLIALLLLAAAPTYADGANVGAALDGYNKGVMQRKCREDPRYCEAAREADRRDEGYRPSIPLYKNWVEGYIRVCVYDNQGYAYYVEIRSSEYCEYSIKMGGGR